MDDGGAVEAVRSNVGFNYRMLLPERFEVDIDKRYALDKLELGQGAYGKVVVAKDKQGDQRLVAVKMIMTTEKETEDLKAHLRLEADIMKELDHPCICKVLEIFDDSRQMFVVIEYCQGGELLQRINELGGLAEGKAAEVMSQVGAALRYAHARGIAHRDIKPENIVFCCKDTSDFQIKVIDWGVACRFNSEQMKVAVGTFHYAAPEVIVPVRAYGPACDMWSLGIVTYVTLSGRLPFEGPPHKLLLQARVERYPMTGEPWDSVSNPGKDFIKKLLKADPSQRLTGESVMRHNWIVRKSERAVIDKAVAAKVVENLQQFRHQNNLTQLCTVAVARQMDHQSLKDIHGVFRDLDRNGDGILTFGEISNGFKRLVGPSETGFKELLDAMEGLDLDKSGTLDYTEFCAAALGGHAAQQVDALWAAFKALDPEEKGLISQEQIEKVVQNLGLPGDEASKATKELVRTLSNIHENSQGSIGFNQLLETVGQTFTGIGMKHCDEDPLRKGQSMSSLTSMPRQSVVYQQLADHAGLKEVAAVPEPAVASLLPIAEDTMEELVSVRVEPKPEDTSGLAEVLV